MLKFHNTSGSIKQTNLILQYHDPVTYFFTVTRVYPYASVGRASGYFLFHNHIVVDNLVDIHDPRAWSRNQACHESSSVEVFASTCYVY